MILVENDDADAVERRIALQHARQNAFGHDLDAGLGADTGFEPGAKTDGRADFFSQHLGHAPRGCTGGETARLQHHDLLCPEPRCIEQRQRDQRRLAGARRCFEDGCAVTVERHAQIGQHGADRQLGRKIFERKSHRDATIADRPKPLFPPWRFRVYADGARGGRRWLRRAWDGWR